MQVNRPRSLFRAVERFPPGPKDYRSPAERGRKLPLDATDEEARSWRSLSSWDTESLALAAARRMLSAKWIVRFDIPPDADLEVEQIGPPGHFDIRGTASELERYLAVDYRLEVRRREGEVE